MDEVAASGFRGPFVAVVGTRPEVIKVAPVVRALRSRNANVALVASGQHRGLAHETFRDLDLQPDIDMDLMAENQSPTSFTARVLQVLPNHLVDLGAKYVLVQGDTATAFAGAFVAYHLGLPVGHVEAGLRSGDHTNPFPEEGNRSLIAQISSDHFAPTRAAAVNLRQEGVAAERIHVVGNTAIDSLLHVLDRERISTEIESDYLLVTLHRRESFGGPIRSLAAAIRQFALVTETARVIWPIHPNPSIRATVMSELAGAANVSLIEPQPYGRFVSLMAGARIILTDSGGVQEEAPSLGKVVLVARETTERPEGLTLARNKLVGRSREGVYRALVESWRAEPFSGSLPAPSPFGDGRSGEKIATMLMNGRPSVEPLSTDA